MSNEQKNQYGDENTKQEETEMDTPLTELQQHDEEEEKEEKEEQSAVVVPALATTTPEEQQAAIVSLEEKVTTTLAIADDDDHDNACPVCLNTPPDNDNNNDNDDDNESYFLVCGPCQHGFCVECMETIVNAKANVHRWPPQSASDVHLAAPTLGRCPICRRDFSLFEMVVKKNNNGNNKNSQQQEQQRLLHPPNVNYHQDPEYPLKDAVYIPYHGGKIGQLSFHWDWTKLRGGEPRPFLNMTLPIQANPERWRMQTSGKLAPKIKHFEPGCHFHLPSRTFHGIIKWEPERLNGSYEWNVVLGFPPDYRFLSSGRIHMKREIQVLLQQDDELPSHYTAEQRQLCRYPFDGRWTVSWPSPHDGGTPRTAEIQVRNNEYTQSGWSFFLNFDTDDPCHPWIRWPKSTYIQKVESGVDLRQEPLGPPVGSTIRWTTTSPNFPYLTWTRQTIGPVPMPKVILFGMGPDKQLYRRLHANTQDAVPRYNGDSLWGNVFCKRLYVGSSSYHFLAPDNCYMSYEHPACRDLPPLDDGAPLPARVEFHGVEFDQEERKLTARIEWEEDFGISWNDNVRWKLNMWFDTEYMVILKGGIQCEWSQQRRARPRPPRRVNPNRPPPVAVYVPPQPETPDAPTPPQERNEEWIMSGYGHDQLYINAASLERYRQPTNGGGGADGPTPPSVDYRALAEQHGRRLETEGATKRSIDFLKHVFELAASKPNSNPIDFLL